jgi:hypothetical protein
MPLTVSQFKALVAEWPDTDDDGEPLEVWLSDRGGLTNEVVGCVPLSDGALLIQPRQDARPQPESP